ncbi:MAG TPA: N-6 DNA methylase [Rectinema sp.]|nr:N-6 DNA methylase [Rectinema sp.]
MLDTITKKKIDDARDILVGKVPVPSSQVEQITIALIYKFMYDMDNESIELGGNPKYFTGNYAKYAWNKLFDQKLSGEGRVMLYQEALSKIPYNASIPTLFRDIFKNAFLPYRDPETLKLFLRCIDEFTYEHSEKLGDAFEYLLAILGSQGDAGQFRTPRHIIDFMVELIDPQKEDSILDPACGTAGFLISAYKHIIKTNSSNYDKDTDPHTFAIHNTPLDELVIQNGKKYTGDLLTPDQRAFLHKNIKGYDIAFEMVRLSLVNMYLHGFNTPQIFEYDTLTSTERWNEYANVILANPPFMTPKGGIRPHQKFTIQAKRSEVLFVDYMLEHLTNNGKAGIIVPEGIIFQSGNAYKQLRKLLVEENYLVGVISLPAGVFNPYSGVKTSILWIDKALAKKTDKIIFLKVNNDGFDLGAQRRPIEANDLPTVFANAMAYKEAVLSGKEYPTPDKDVIIMDKSRLAESGDYNLSGDRYFVTSKRCNSQFQLVGLGEICDLYQPQTITGNDLIEDGEFPVFGANGIIGRYHSYNHPESEVVITCRGATCGTINKTLPKSWITGNAMVAHPKSGIISKEYLFYCLKFSDLSSTISGSAQPQITRASLSSFKIPLPPLSAQEEIVAELDCYQKIIDGAKQVVDNWKPRIDIDPEWSIVQVKDVCSVNPESSDPSDLWDDWFTYIDIASIDNATNSIAQLNRISVSEAPSRARRIVVPHDVIISTVRPNLKAFHYFDTVPDRAIVSTGFAVLRASDTIHPKYLYYMLLSEYMVNQMISKMGKGSYPSINQSDVNELNIPLPDLTIQQAIIENIDREQDLINSLRQLITIYEHNIKDKVDVLWRTE